MGINQNAPIHINSISEYQLNGGNIKKIMTRNVDGKPEVVMKTDDGYYVASDGNGWDKIEVESDGAFRKKTFRTVNVNNENKVIVTNKQNNKETEPVSSGPVTALSPAPERQQALSKLGNFEQIVAAYEETHGETEPCDITGKSPEELSNLENGTPVFVMKETENGERKKITGVIIDGMVVRSRTIQSSLGFENNYTQLDAYDPNAYTNGDQNYKIGGAVLIQGEADIRL